MSEQGNRTSDTVSHDRAVFVTGTCLATDMGEVPIDWLRPGDRLLTRDCGYLPVCAIMRTTIESDAVVMIGRATHHSHELPHPILLSQRHGVLTFAAQRNHLMDQHERLIPAASVPGAVASPRSGRLLCYTLSLDTHQIILANGLWVEVGIPHGERNPARPRHMTTRSARLRSMAA